MNLSDVKLPIHFPGIVRLFPLPNLVIYPGVVQALHIFEPRYRKMMSDLLAADQLVSMCLYKNPRPSQVATELPSIHEVICIGKIIAHKELDDGRFNSLVLGVKRARIVRELPVEQPYRMAEVKVIDDEVSASHQLLLELKGQLLESCQAIDLYSKLARQLDLKKIIEAKVDLGLLVDLISFSMKLDCQQRQHILELANVEARCLQLIEYLRDYDNSNNAESRFPPDFSSN